MLLGLAALGATATTFGACGGGQADNSVKYAVTAQQNYDQGQEKLKKKAWIGAAKYFAFVKARFAYSKFAVLAELRLADAEFGAGHHLQAVDGYKMFMKFHPTHDMVINGYCAYRIGESYYKMLPGDWWILPPSYEKDQSASADAYRQLSNFLTKYPKSPYLEKAQTRLRKINERLAKHEMYVAKFYWERNRPMGTVIRLRKLLASHRGTRLDAPALYLLGKAYIKVKMPARAKEVWSDLIKSHPTDSRAKKAQTAMAQISG